MHPLHRHWGGEHRPLRAKLLRTARGGAGFDFTAAMRALCQDITRRCPEFAGLDWSRVLITAAVSRNRSQYGLQARVTPMRFPGGSLTTRRRGRLYGIERFHVDGREMLYLLTFILPRFLNQLFEEKLITVFHEMYHISPAFDGDIRRHPGRYSAHSHSKCEYDQLMKRYADDYLRTHDQPELFEFLRSDFRDMQTRHGGVRVIVVPRPKLIPVTAVPPLMTGC